MKKTLLTGLAVGLTILGLGNTANALTIYGQVWAPASASANDPEIVPAGPAQATFTVETINFDSRNGSVTYDDFLSGSPGNSNPNNLIWTYIAPSFNVNSFYTASGYEGSFFQLTGIAHWDADTVITHDDGFYLTLGNTIYDYSTPVGPTPTNLHNAAGNYSFTLNYGATNGFPEVLQVRLSEVPEPSTLLLFGTGVVGLAGIARRKRTN